MLTNHSNELLNDDCKTYWTNGIKRATSSVTTSHQHHITHALVIICHPMGLWTNNNVCYLNAAKVEDNHRTGDEHL